MPLLVVLDDQRQQIEAVSFNAAKFRLVVEIAFDFVNRSFVVGFRADELLSSP
jgi:hypothetical protein